MFPSRSRSSYRHRVAIALVVLLHFRRVRAWYAQDDNPWLQLARQRYPLIDAAIYLPYLNGRWGLEQRLRAIDQHYRLLIGPAEILARALTESVVLARFDEECPGLCLVLDKAPWLALEGEVTLNLFLGEVRYYSLAFSLDRNGDETMILLGALQGSNAASAREVYRAMTHALHGMRPRDLLVTALRLLAVQFGVGRIWAVNNEARQCTSAYYGPARKSHIHVDLDRIWTENGGRALNNGFFEIPVQLRCRSMEDIPSRKRSAYKRRYRMLARTALALEAACGNGAPLAAPASTRAVPPVLDLPLETP